MSSTLSEMIITKIHAFNRVNVMENTVGGYAVPRDKSAIAIKTVGCTEYQSAGIHYLSDSTHAILLPKGAVYSWICKQKGECLMVEFDGENVPEALTLIKIKNCSEIATVFARLENLMIFRKPAYTVKCMQGIYEILVKLCESDASDYSLISKKNKIAKSVEYLEEHCLSDDISIEKLADISGISSVYFRKIFSEIYGMPPMQYVGRIRIEKAKGMLIGDFISVTQIAEMSGFGSVYHFCKAFKKATGLTPTEWAKNVNTK